jgi:hypothetical protein
LTTNRNRYDHRKANSVFDFDDDGELTNVAGDPTHRQVEIGLASLLKKQCATFSVIDLGHPAFRSPHNPVSIC